MEGVIDYLQNIPTNKVNKTISKLLHTINDIGLIRTPLLLINKSMRIAPLSIQKVDIIANKLYSTMKISAIVLNKT